MFAIPLGLRATRSGIAGSVRTSSPASNAKLASAHGGCYGGGVAEPADTDEVFVAGWVVAFAVVIALAAASLVVMAFSVVGLRADVHHMRVQLDCLAHPHGESSTYGMFKNGHFVQGPVTRTGCQP